MYICKYHLLDKPNRILVGNEYQIVAEHTVLCSQCRAEKAKPKEVSL